MPVCDVSLVYNVILMNRWHKVTVIWMFFVINDGYRGRLFPVKISSGATTEFSYNTDNQIK